MSIKRILTALFAGAASAVILATAAGASNQFPKFDVHFNPPSIYSPIVEKPQGEYVLCEIKEPKEERQGNELVIVKKYCTLIDNPNTNNYASDYALCFARAYGIGRATAGDVVLFEDVTFTKHVSQLVLKCGYYLAMYEGTATQYWVYLNGANNPIAKFQVSDSETRSSQIKDQVYKSARVSIAPGTYDIYIVAQTEYSGSCSELYCVYGSEPKATIPTFPVSINGKVVENQNALYPCIVYNDITYFPMTYFNAQALGLQSEWTAENGLVITKTGAAPATVAFEQNSTPNAPEQTAQLVTGPITVNGKAIDNASEEYPLLLFRDITYFPLTWRFMVEEFGWSSSFDIVNGLSVFSN